ncbi:MAG TPA: 30S ribosomal protein S13 [Candidatus Nanoarchaeia archaeon]|nr:30S ribosomal protein S13 [Candidatus Nanoarchaeia archaeon]
MAEQSKDFKHLVRIANTDIDGNKTVQDAMRRIKGVSFMYANMICTLASLDRHAKIGDMNDSALEKIEDALRNPVKYGAPAWMLNRRRDYESGEDMHVLTADIDFFKSNDLKRMKMIKCYKGIRHMEGLPVRGQSTKSNFRKNKGKVLGVKSAGKKAGTT